MSGGGWEVKIAVVGTRMQTVTFSYINTFDLDHFQTLLSKLLYIEVPPFQNKNSKTVVILIFIWVGLRLSTKYSCH